MKSTPVTRFKQPLNFETLACELMVITADILLSGLSDDAVDCTLCGRLIAATGDCEACAGNSFHWPTPQAEERALAQFRCTRPALYEANQTLSGYNNPEAREGHYIWAYGRNRALEIMADRFPGDTHFTAHPTGKLRPPSITAES